MMHFTPNYNLYDSKNSTLPFFFFIFTSKHLFSVYFLFLVILYLLFKSVFFSPPIPKSYLCTNFPGSLCQLISEFNLFIFTLITLILELKSAELLNILQFPCFLLVFFYPFIYLSLDT